MILLLQKRTTQIAVPGESYSLSGMADVQFPSISFLNFSNMYVVFNLQICKKNKRSFFLIKAPR